MSDDKRGGDRRTDQQRTVAQERAAQMALHGAMVVVDTTDVTPEEAEAVAEWQAACRKLGRFSHRAEFLNS